jgi:uracil-DNA glycosylase family 4
MNSLVPNKFPTSASCRIAIVGEAPGKDEDYQKEPFVGTAGRFLKALMARAGIDPDTCLLASVCQIRPPGNDLAMFSWSGVEIQDGLAQLKSDLAEFKPNLVVLLGRVALRAAKDPNQIKGPKAFPIDNWRGSFFVCDNADSPMFGYKCIATYHPAAALRQYELTPLLQMDLRKAAGQSRSPEWVPPHRDIYISDPTGGAELVQKLYDVLMRKPKIACDIEGYWDNMTHLSIAEAKDKCFVIPFWDNLACYEHEIWRLVSQIMDDPTIVKIFQNGLYDRFCLQYGHRIRVRGALEDTMVKHAELYSELPKSLGTLTSLYTLQPYYKGDRKSNDEMTFRRYNGMDSCITYEVSDRLDKLLDPRQKEHYRFNIDLLNLFLYMEIRGFRYDWDKAKLRQKEVFAKMYEKQHALNQVAGPAYCLNGLVSADLLRKVADLMYYKRGTTILNGEIVGQVKADYVGEPVRRAIELARKSELSAGEWGELETLLECHMNVDSPKLKDYLYGKLCLPHQFKKNAEGVEVLSTDYLALLNLRRVKPHPAVDLIIDIRSLGTRAGILGIHPDPDGRIRAGYNVVGTETMRITCYTSPTGSGHNLQTQPEEDRDLLIADPGCEIFQCDLAGADGWTVAAYLKMLGCSAMWDDYMSGLKPAKIVALMHKYGPGINSKPRSELRELSKEIDQADWMYFACKRVQHGTSYLMGPQTCTNTIFKDSEGKLWMPMAETKRLQGLFTLRYKVNLWHDYLGRQLRAKPIQVAASGHKRIFFGRPTEILAQALANEPQQNTTYATNLAAHKLILDSENRTPEGRFIIEPLHQVHDALVGQWPIECREWAKAKILSYFNNNLMIANMVVRIPFEGSYGPTWAKSTHTGKIEFK